MQQAAWQAVIKHPHKLKSINHNDANFEFRTLYRNFEDDIIELQFFLKDIHKYISTKEIRLSKAKIYSLEFEELFWTQSRGQIFRDSFIISSCTVGETYLKSYCLLWMNLLEIGSKKFTYKNGLLDTLKEIEKQHLKLGIDFSKEEIAQFRGLLAVRHSLIHSNGSLHYVENFVPIIKQLAKKYPSLKILDDKFIITDETFCSESLIIIKKFVFYLFKLAIKQFPNYRIDVSEFDFEKPTAESSRN